MGRALPHRHNIIVTRDRSYVAEGCTIADSAELALKAAGNVPEIAVIGGAEEIFQKLLPQADILHMTYIHAEINGDTLLSPAKPGRLARARPDGTPHGAEKSLPYPSSHCIAAPMALNAGEPAAVGARLGTSSTCWPEQVAANRVGDRVSPAPPPARCPDCPRRATRVRPTDDAGPPPPVSCASLPRQPQPAPGLARKLEPPADHGEESYEGSGKLGPGARPSLRAVTGDRSGGRDCLRPRGC